MVAWKLKGIFIEKIKEIIERQLSVKVRKMVRIGWMGSDWIFSRNGALITRGYQ